MTGSDLLRLARAKGSDRQYLDWLRSQPSALGTGWDYDWELGNVCTPAHYRTSANSGTGTKPAYSAIPLRHEEHQQQHRVGQFIFRPRSWWEEQVDKHLKRWVESQ